MLLCSCLSCFIILQSISINNNSFLSAQATKNLKYQKRPTKLYKLNKSINFYIILFSKYSSFPCYLFTQHPKRQYSHVNSRCWDFPALFYVSMCNIIRNTSQMLPLSLARTLLAVFFISAIRSSSSCFVSEIKKIQCLKHK